MEDDALVVIDVQNDFCPGGALAVSKGDEVVPLINKLMGQFRHVVLTQDWHPAGHSSFASTHKGQPFTSIKLDYGDQTLWPDHCVQGTKGAEFHAALKLTG
ncbi:MAG: isochorismatase family protein, partial [Rhodospirillaceae bacterium]|nr:isochorismatase family protein [Rhodospirillaceae bacterium]